MVMQIINVISIPVISQVQIISHSRILRPKRVNLFYHRYNTMFLAPVPNPVRYRNSISNTILINSTRNLEIAKTLLLCLHKQSNWHILEQIICLQLVGSTNNILQFIQKPAVYFCQIMNLFYRISGTHSL